ncbi:hypothetical protein ACFW15_35615, partial [Streptomyces sp. NPDC058953]
MSTSPRESSAAAPAVSPVPVPVPVSEPSASEVSPAAVTPAAVSGPSEPAVQAECDEALAWFPRVRDRARRSHWTVERTG